MRLATYTPPPDGLEDLAGGGLEDQAAADHLVEHVVGGLVVEDEVQLAHILKAAVQRLHKDLDEVQDAQLRLTAVDHEAEVERRVVPVDHAHALPAKQRLGAGPGEEVAHVAGRARGDQPVDLGYDFLLLGHILGLVPIASPLTHRLLVELDEPRLPGVVDCALAWPGRGRTHEHSLNHPSQSSFIVVMVVSALRPPWHCPLTLTRRARSTATRRPCWGPRCGCG